MILTSVLLLIYVCVTCLRSFVFTFVHVNSLRQQYFWMTSSIFFEPYCFCCFRTATPAACELARSKALDLHLLYLSDSLLNQFERVHYRWEEQVPRIVSALYDFSAVMLFCEYYVSRINYFSLRKQSFSFIFQAEFAFTRSLVPFACCFGDACPD